MPGTTAGAACLIHGWPFCSPGVRTCPPSSRSPKRLTCAWTGVVGHTLTGAPIRQRDARPMRGFKIPPYPVVSSSLVNSSRNEGTSTHWLVLTTISITRAGGQHEMDFHGKGSVQQPSPPLRRDRFIGLNPAVSIRINSASRACAMAARASSHDDATVSQFPTPRVQPEVFHRRRTIPVHGDGRHSAVQRCRSASPASRSLKFCRRRWARQTSRSLLAGVAQQRTGGRDTIEQYRPQKLEGRIALGRPCSTNVAQLSQTGFSSGMPTPWAGQEVFTRPGWNDWKVVLTVPW